MHLTIHANEQGNTSHAAQSTDNTSLERQQSSSNDTSRSFSKCTTVPSCIGNTVGGVVRAGNLHALNLLQPPIPICDLNKGSRYTEQERILRNKLACLYRLVDLFQWSEGIYNHITLRLPLTSPNSQVEILINPLGLLYHEITSSSLIKINLSGDILDGGSTSLRINKAAYILHSAIHDARGDVECVIHLHTPAASAVASMKCGLLPICQEGMLIGPVGYHDFKGILVDEEERASIVKDLGDKNVMFLRNHGFVVCGESTEDALHLAFNCITACEMQVTAISAGLENLVIPDEESVAKAYASGRRGAKLVNFGKCNESTKDSTLQSANEEDQGWQSGEMEWEAWMRQMDAAGFRTGHVYRQPMLLRHRRSQPTTEALK